MATHAELIPSDVDSSGVRIVAVRAFYALVKHLALNEGSEHIDLVVDLPVHVISGSTHVGSPRLGYLGKKMIQKSRTNVMPGMYETTPSMALCTGLDLSLA